MTRSPKSRDERFMEWLRRKNALYAPLVQPFSLMGFIAALLLNRPDLASACATLLAVSLAAGKPPQNGS